MSADHQVNMPQYHHVAISLSLRLRITSSSDHNRIISSHHHVTMTPYHMWSQNLCNGQCILNTATKHAIMLVVTHWCRLLYCHKAASMMLDRNHYKWYSAHMQNHTHLKKKIYIYICTGDHVHRIGMCLCLWRFDTACIVAHAHIGTYSAD